MRIYYTVITTQILLFMSCTVNTSKDNNNSTKNISIENQIVNVDTMTRLSKNTDSVEIICDFFDISSDKFFTVYLSDLELKKIETFNQENIVYVENESIKNKLTGYINLFYIDKSENIYFSINEIPAPVTEYPYIKVIRFETGNKRDITETTLYSNINFNPKFLEFYYLLESLDSER